MPCPRPTSCRFHRLRHVLKKYLRMHGHLELKLARPIMVRRPSQGPQAISAHEERSGLC